MPDIVVWVTKPSDKDVPDLEAVGQEVKSLEHVSEVTVSAMDSAIHVQFEGDKAEQEQIKHAIQETGYEIFKVSR